MPCKDRIGLLNVLLSEGLNLGLSKMAGATNTHDFFQLSRLSRWHVESEAMARALATVIEGQSRLPMARFWGGGQSASSDGQFFPTTRQGEAMNLINAKYGHEPGLKAYTHVSDQFGPFATQTIPATVNEAPYILCLLYTSLPTASRPPETKRRSPARSMMFSAARSPRFCRRSKVAATRFAKPATSWSAWAASCPANWSTPRPRSMTT